MTVRRYHPHALQKQLRDLPAVALSDAGSLPAETILRAGWWWEDPAGPLSNPEAWPDTGSPHLQAPEGGLAEFGQDAVRLAGLTAPAGTIPDTDLLASAWRWLAGFHECFLGWRSSGEATAAATEWDPRPWIRAGAAARDHLLSRSRVYPGLAAVRKAWKEAPVTPTTPPAGKRLALLLLAPFAPVLARVLAQFPTHFSTQSPTQTHTQILTQASTQMSTQIPTPLPRLPTLVSMQGPASSFLETSFGPEDRGLSRHLAAFPPLEPVCISFSRGGRRWEALDRRGLEASPRERLAELPFLTATLRQCDWSARAVRDGWLVELCGRKA